MICMQMYGMATYAFVVGEWREGEGRGGEERRGEERRGGEETRGEERREGRDGGMINHSDTRVLGLFSFYLFFSVCGGCVVHTEGFHARGWLSYS